LIQSCIAQEFASSYKSKNKTERLVITKIRALPEVRGFFKYVKRDKPDFIINPADSNNNCYAMQIGIDFGDIFRTHFGCRSTPKLSRYTVRMLTIPEWKPLLYSNGGTGENDPNLTSLTNGLRGNW
jgi:hypothetical protein